MLRYALVPAAKAKMIPKLLRAAWVRIMVSLLAAYLLVKFNRAQVYNAGLSYDYFTGFAAALVIYGILTYAAGILGKQHKNTGRKNPPGNNQ